MTLNTLNTPGDRASHAIVSRFMAGDTAESLAYDFDCPLSHVEACLRWGLRRYRGKPPEWPR